MSSVQDLSVFRSQYPWGRSVVGVEQALSLSCNSTERDPVLRRLRLTPLGQCLRVIVNEMLKKTTSSVLVVILINLWHKETHSKL